jgi:hypothetical protein
LGKQVLGNETYLWKTVRDALSRSLSWKVPFHIQNKQQVMFWILKIYQRSYERKELESLNLHSGWTQTRFVKKPDN